MASYDLVRESRGRVTPRGIVCWHTDMGNLRETLFKFYYRVESLLTPGLRNAQFLYRETLEARLAPGTCWLDIGCGRRLFPDWMPRGEEAQIALKSRLKTAFGIDPDFSSLKDNPFVQNRVAGDCGSLPFADSSFDFLTANMVVEHVANPHALLLEARRVLKPNGIFLFHTPNSLSYATAFARLVPQGLKARLIAFFEGRKEEDVFPTHYRMNTPARVRDLSASAGFRIVDLMRVESSAQAVMLGPLVIIELLWIRLLRFPALRDYRSNLVVVLQKQA
jgi:SAM-dependent methyltransferase